MVGFYLAYAILHLDVQWSAGLAALILAGAVSGTAALLSTLHDERTIGMNVGFSCVLTLQLLTFAGFCLIVGVFVATLVLLVQ